MNTIVRVAIVGVTARLWVMLGHSIQQNADGSITTTPPGAAQPIVIGKGA